MGTKIGPLQKVRLLTAQPGWEPVVVNECTITIIGRLSTWNEILNLPHKSTKKKKSRNDVKQAEAAEIALAWRRAGCPKIVGPYTIHYVHCRSDVKFDPPNISGWAVKSIPDALQKNHCGIDCIEDDTWKLYRGDSHEFVHDPKRDYVKVTITAVGEDF